MSTPFALPFVRWANLSVLTGGAPVAQRRLYDHELVYSVGGTGQISIEEKWFDATPDRLFFIQPRVWHSFQTRGELHLLGIHFDWIPQHDTLAFPIFRPADEPVEETKFREPREIANWALSAQPFLDLRGRPRVRRALEEVISHYNQNTEYSRESAGALLAHAIFLISNEARALQQLAHSTRIGPDALRRVQRARELLEKSPELAISIEKVAAQVGWSSDHLRRSFREVLGTSPLQIQINARLGLARQLLREEILPINKIANLCGFKDASHFARVFKAETGLSPRQFLVMIGKN